MRPLGDRRAHVRMEVVGDLWGTLELTETARLVDISTTGVLLDSPVPAAQDSVQALSLRVDGALLTIEAGVRRVEHVATQGSPRRYYIGLEFVAPPSRLLEAIEDFGKISGR